MPEDRAVRDASKDLDAMVACASREQGANISDPPDLPGGKADARMGEAEFDEFILANMPHFIAVNYKQLLETQDPREQVTLALHIYQLGLRALTIGLVNQYLVRDLDSVSDPFLNDLLVRKLPRPTPDAWQQILFVTLRAYEGKQDLLFIPELYDFYWDTVISPHQQRRGIEQPFERLTQLSVEEIAKRLFRDDIGWTQLAAETVGLLRQILHHVSFIAEYDVIRILDDGSQYYELHKGLEITQVRLPQLPKLELNRGWFYLRKKTGEFLPLHPLLVFLQQGVGSSDLVSADTGLYENFIYERLAYLLTSLRKIVTDYNNVSAFVGMLFDTIEEVKQRRQYVENLTWWRLRDICADISEKRTASVRKKYYKELYLQRDKTLEAFENFLRSEKRCFVLIGKSGVGKSNFGLALSEQLQQSRNDVCVLMYDGAKLDVTQSITGSINQDFTKRLSFKERSMGSVWQEIMRIEDIEQRKVILWIDAINENPQAKELLRQLDELTQDPWPWLKIVFSSRPETWHTIKRGVKLAEALYYREDGSETLGIELEPFSYSEQLESFSRQELPKAYARYQDVFQLQTSYDDLPLALREILRDPLSLWLVAKTYQKQAIPNTLKVTELIERYIQALVERDVLHLEDLQLLEQRLVLLMVHKGQFRNTITMIDLGTAGGGLYEAVYSEQLLSDGHRMNQSFINLVDAEILIHQEQGREQRIAFKYERFYEYFVGQALFRELSEEHKKSAWEQQYRAWIAHLPSSPYLWGAVKNCLVKQMRDLPVRDSTSLCMQLAQTSDQHMLEMLIAALTEYGTDEREQATKIIKNILDHSRIRINSVLRRELSTKQCPTWKKVAISVVSNLRIKELMVLALTDSSPAVRAVALRHAFIYWRTDRAEGFALLESLMTKAIWFWRLPNLPIFESLVGLSLLILFYDFRNPETIKILRGLWRRAIEQILLVNPSQLGGQREYFKERMRTVVLRIAAGFVVRTASEAPSNSMLSIPELKRFFMKDGALERRREIALKLATYLDVAETNIQEMQDDMLTLAEERDIFIALLAVTVLQKHGVVHPEITLPLLKDLFDRAIEVDPPGPFSIVPSPALLAEPEYGMHQLKFELMQYFITTRLDRFQGKWWSNMQVRRLTFFDALCFSEICDIRDVPITPLVRGYIEIAIRNREYSWLEDIIQWDATSNGIERGFPRFAFSILEMLINIEVKSIREALIESLARLRVYYPDDVEDFMADNNVDENFMIEVRMRAPSESIGDLLNLRAVIFFDEAVMLGDSPDFWRKWIWLMKQLSERNSLESWLTILFKFVVNEIYGAPIFSEIPA